MRGWTAIPAQHLRQIRPYDLVQNQDFDWRKMSNFDETLQTDQIEGAEFKFLGLEDRFERNKRRKFLNVEIEILEPKSKFRLGHAWSRAQKSTLQDSYKIWPLIIRRRENCHAPKSTSKPKFLPKIVLAGLFSVLEKHFSSTSSQMTRLARRQKRLRQVHIAPCSHTEFLMPPTPGLNNLLEAN